MKKPETKFKEKVFKRLDKIPSTWYYKVHSPMQYNLPDIIICCNGLFAAWELKDVGKKAKVGQKAILDIIKLANGISEVVTPDTLDQKIHELVKKALKRNSITQQIENPQHL